MSPLFAHPIVRVAIAAALALPVVPAYADCVDGVRAATPAELEFAARARAALIAGLPAPPVQTERRGKPHDFAEQPKFDFCKDTPIGAFAPSVSEGYLYTFARTDAERRSAERRRLLQQIEEIETLPPEKEAQRKVLLEQMRAAYDAAPKRSRKDPPLPPEQQALADKQNAEGRRLEGLANQVAQDHRASVKHQTDPLRARADALNAFPQELVLVLHINAARFPEPAESVATFGVPSPRQNAALKVLNVVLEVRGPEGAARQALLAAVDRGYLQGLVGQQLPDVGASQARAAAAAAPGPASANAAPPVAPSATEPAPSTASSARPGSAPPGAKAPPPDAQKKPEPASPAGQDAANAVNRLRGLLGR
jgi:hypothetical protein